MKIQFRRHASSDWGATNSLVVCGAYSFDRYCDKNKRQKCRILNVAPSVTQRKKYSTTRTQLNSGYYRKALAGSGKGISHTTVQSIPNLLSL